jgi:hypothetical protein
LLGCALADIEGAPEEFLDPLMCDIMRDPGMNCFLIRIFGSPHVRTHAGPWYVCMCLRACVLARGVVRTCCVCARASA